MLELPSRYEPLARLGAGGGGEVWSVRDRVTGDVLALKVLAERAGAAEVGALVREAIALSGLEGLGVPRVVAFGALAGGRRYMVRELVEGRSLEECLAAGEGDAAATAGVDAEQRGRAATSAIASACDQLTVIHRAGLLHGDVKPANIIVGEGGRATLVDLGLAAPWRDGGTAARGVTPKYAAPELLAGEPLTVRAEVYALGATLSEALAHTGDELEEGVRFALAKVAARATEAAPARRWPSVDEFASALRAAARLPAHVPTEPPWPVLGADAAAHALLERVRLLPERGAIAIEGVAGSGRTTLARRIAWTLGIEGRGVAFVEAPRAGAAICDVVTLELERAGASLADSIVLVDDGDLLDEPARAALRRASQSGARLVIVAPLDAVAPLAAGAAAAFAVPPLTADIAANLVRRAVPSLPDALCDVLVERTGRWPGPLRAAVRALAGRAIVGEDDVDRALAEAAVPPEAVRDPSANGKASHPPRKPRRDSATSLAAGRGTTPPGDAHKRAFDDAERALDRGRFDEAAKALGGIDAPHGEAERARHGLALAQIAIGRGDAARALEELHRVERAASATGRGRAWKTLRARAYLRAGQYAEAAQLAQSIAEAFANDAIAAEALSVRGVALAFTGDDAGARQTLDRAVEVARALGNPRVEGVALGSSAIAHQRGGRPADARASYERGARRRGARRGRGNRRDDAPEPRRPRAGRGRARAGARAPRGRRRHGAARGQRRGGDAGAPQPRQPRPLPGTLRPRPSLDRPPRSGARRPLTGGARAAPRPRGRARRANRPGGAGGGALRRRRARVGRAGANRTTPPSARLEGLLARARDSRQRIRGRWRCELEAIRSGLGTSGFGEHEALAELVRGAIAHAAGDEDGARRAHRRGDRRRRARRAGASGRGRRSTRARASRPPRARAATARRDTEAALAMLEETAAKLPRDLREVFWDDPRRRALRHPAAGTALGDRVGELPAGLAAGPTGGHDVDLHRAPRRGPPGAHPRDHARARERARRAAPASARDRSRGRAARGRARLRRPRGRRRRARGAGGADPRRRRRAPRPILALGRRAGRRDAASRSSPSARATTSASREAVSVHQLMIQSIACVPIRGAPPVGRTIGALYVETRLRPGRALRARAADARRLRGPGGDRHRERAPPRREPRARRRAGPRQRASWRAARDELARTARASAPSSSPRRGAT